MVCAASGSGALCISKGANWAFRRFAGRRRDKKPIQQMQGWKPHLICTPPRNLTWNLLKMMVWTKRNQFFSRDLFFFGSMLNFRGVSCIPNGLQCREYLLTFLFECGHFFSPNIGKYSIHSEHLGMDTAYVKGTLTPKTSLLDTGPGNPPFLVPESVGDVSRPHLCKFM